MFLLLFVEGEPVCCFGMTEQMWRWEGQREVGGVAEVFQGGEIEEGEDVLGDFCRQMEDRG